MNLLVDTHIAIWALNDDEALSAKARQLILNPAAAKVPFACFGFGDDRGIQYRRPA